MFVRGFYSLSPEQQQALNPGGYPIDAYGQVVQPNQQQYLYQYGGGMRAVWKTNPFYSSSSGQNGVGSGNGAVAPVAPHQQFTFDTIGQTIFRSIGHCRLPLRLIWVQGIEASGDLATSSTVSFAAALCQPIDPDEEGSVAGVFAGETALFGDAGVVIPDGMSDTTAALLTASITNALVFPGDQAQLPCDLIVADKGADRTNAFRGIRYIVFPGWPLDAGLPSNLSISWTRANPITFNGPPSPSAAAAVEFAAGAG